MKKSYAFSGFAISFVLHAMLLVPILAMTRFVPGPEIPMVIDFSITNARPEAASVVAKKASNVSNRMAARQPLVPPAEKKPSKPARSKTAKIKKNKTPKPVKPAPEEIKTVKKVIAEPPQEVVAVNKEEPAHSPPEPLQEVLPVDSQRGARSSVTQGVDDPEPAGGMAGTIGGGSQDPRARYIKAHFEYIKNTIQKQITYPVVARKKGWQGKVVVSFVVDKDGNIMDIQIRESSGFSLLDRNAVQTIKKLAPFPPPPIRAELIVPINYSLV